MTSSAGEIVTVDGGMSMRISSSEQAVEGAAGAPRLGIIGPDAIRAARIFAPLSRPADTRWHQWRRRVPAPLPAAWRIAAIDVPVSPPLPLPPLKVAAILGFRRGRVEHHAAFLGCRADSFITSRAFGASGFWLGRHGSSVNHQASDLSQPSPGVVAACALQPVEPGWQPMRMWK